MATDLSWFAPEQATRYTYFSFSPVKVGALLTYDCNKGIAYHVHISVGLFQFLADYLRTNACSGPWLTVKSRAVDCPS